MKVIDRRQFLQMGLAAGAGVVAASTLAPAVLAGEKPKPVSAGDRTNLKMAPRIQAAPIAQRRMVVLDLGGGNDGLSMLPPRGTTGAAYRSLRPRTAIAEADMLDLSAYGTTSVGLHPSLVRVRARGMQPSRASASRDRTCPTSR